MGKIFENDFKIMIVELLKSRRRANEISNEYNIWLSLLGPKFIFRSHTGY